ncbi:hypothetical protein A2W54_01660 [Candidatus Giovannonibacteria bacterium RIFCSPHIGHO2_02_43_13]|uniref:DUF541 domain-containing protein n=1 Tax=Candidatus Giovannonibacteria bacterium RIFCSPHIGHO2_02_43_13 TaxID=1798330 RepID=A0A1F5WUY4_9BACT|nr:MAG: hypothetical protein A3E06_03685 [Candidatus Giovannonibacteria bacterium RIFCSPHIGHO2_12_FULL_44_42]OGF79434.1 MAG: hypothetical protein A2W54_01660 [Candidatus Giovannonibacteria bacterium RIFCSPHIGHO2_02_43_13]OGF89296.1 MAG: hypothetical protein A3I94_01715 [Candidatus Giovannonibacteria bacterium RIFCSPLOWO2_02_FULL_43_54]OGF97468.1 MAG: hypothetical protein A3H08_02305 [Candidatus Giovannonibacteria bacterium RIFCSPLOWO2_12_FULL_44_32]
MNTNEKLKGYLGWVIMAFIGVLSFAVLSYVQTYANSIEPGTYRSFSVSGEGKVVAVPDVAEFSFSVITQGGKDLGVLQKDNTAKVNKIIEFIKSKGVDAKDIKTENYSVEPRYANYTCKPVIMASDSAVAYPVDRSCHPPDIVGYTITQSVSVKARDFTKTGELLSGAVSNGANSVSRLFFTIDDPTTLKNQVRAEAIEKAQGQAKAMAKAAGFKLGRLLSIDEGYNYPIYRTMEAYGKGGDVSAMPAPAPAIEPGSQDIAVTVNLRYEIR